MRNKPMKCSRPPSLTEIYKAHERNYGVRLPVGEEADPDEAERILQSRGWRLKHGTHTYTNHGELRQVATSQLLPPEVRESGEQVLACCAAMLATRDGMWIKGAPTHIFPEFLRQLEVRGWGLHRRPVKRAEPGPEDVTPPDSSCEGCGAQPSFEHAADCPVYLALLRRSADRVLGTEPTDVRDVLAVYLAAGWPVVVSVVDGQAFSGRVGMLGEGYVEIVSGDGDRHVWLRLIRRVNPGPLTPQAAPWWSMPTPNPGGIAGAVMDGSFDGLNG